MSYEFKVVCHGLEEDWWHEKEAEQSWTQIHIYSNAVSTAAQYVKQSLVESGAISIAAQYQMQSRVGRDAISAECWKQVCASRARQQPFQPAYCRIYIICHL